MDYCCISKEAEIGEGTKIHSYVNIYTKCSIGSNCIIGAFVEIGPNVKIGNGVKISSHVFICEGVTIEDDVFIGHGVMFTNDRYPRTIDPNGVPTSATNTVIEETVLRTKCSIGTGSTILSGVEVGRNAMVGAGSVVTKSIPDGGLAYGNPCRLKP
jgi:UDP-2-acetamido-3-amino-2,3-dideoxy-glucuronate N-acetyltransferase